MTINRKKLSLKKESLRNLTEADLNSVAGGALATVATKLATDFVATKLATDLVATRAATDLVATKAATDFAAATVATVATVL